MRFGLLAAAGLALSSHAVAAQVPVTLSRAVFVERTSATPDGLDRSIEAARQLQPGDKVVLMVEWRTERDKRGFTVTSPIPANLAFQRSSDDAVEISIDGGKSWGQLGELRIGDRLASPEEVTNLRWRVTPREAARGSGRVTYSALVR